MSKVRDKEMVEGRPSRFVGLDENGIEHPDPTPIEMPTRLRMPGNQVERMRSVIRRELSAQAERNSFESFDEADDFEMEEVEWSSPYEESFEPSVAELREREKAAMVEGRRNGAAKEMRDGESSGREVDVARTSDNRVGVGVGSERFGAAGGKAGKPAGRESRGGEPDSGREGAQGEGADD